MPLKSRSDPLGMDLRADLEALLALGQNHSRPLSNAMYTSEEVAALERERIFFPEWVCLGHAGEIPNPGDYLATEVADEPLLMVRGDDAEIRVLSNVCRHRGMRLRSAPGCESRLSCPYHGWTYDLRGRLVGAPYMESAEGFRLDEHCLPVFASEVWQGFVFVNLDRTATPLAPRLFAALPCIRNYHLDDMRHSFATEDVWATNWKCLVENAMEGYHLSRVHPNSLQSTPTDLCEKFPGGEAYTGYRSHYPPESPQREPYHPDLTETEKRCSTYLCVFPSFVIGIGPHGAVYQCIRPLGVDRLVTRWGFVSFGDTSDSVAMEQWKDAVSRANAEDRAILESLSRGLRSRFLEPARLAPADYEGTIWDIQRYVARRLTGD